MDSDADGLDDAAEVAAGTHPGNADTDGDGVADALDPYPVSLVTATIEAPSSTLVGDSFVVGVRLSDSHGHSIGAGSHLRTDGERRPLHRGGHRHDPRRSGHGLRRRTERGIIRRAEFRIRRRSGR